MSVFTFIHSQDSSRVAESRYYEWVSENTKRVKKVEISSKASLIYSEEWEGVHRIFHRENETLVIMGDPVRYGGATDDVDYSEFLAQYKIDKKSAVERLDGGYLILVFGRENMVDVVTDHLGSYRLFWKWTKHSMILSTRLMDVYKYAGENEEVNTQECISFILTGMNIGPDTFYKNIQKTTGGKILQFDVSESRMRQTTWWDLKFKRKSVRGRVKKLDEALRRECEKLLKEPSRITFAATGGNDSKLLAYYMEKLGINPEVCFTWCDMENVEKSDPVIAKKICEDREWTHTTVVFDKGLFAKNVESWLVESSLQSDNMGNFVVAEREITEMIQPNRAILVGEEMFGPGGWFGSSDSAVRGYLKTPWPDVSKKAKRLLTEEGRIDFAEVYQSKVRKDLEGLDSPSPKDINHYISYKWGVEGWLMAPGFYKLPHYKMKRPFVQRSIMDMVSGWPGKYRVDKLIAHKILKKFEKKYGRYPKATVDVLPDWPELYRSDPSVRSCIENELRKSFQAHAFMKNYLDEEAIFQSLDRVCLEDASQVKCGGVLHMAVKIRRILNEIPGVRFFAKWIEISMDSYAKTPDKTTEFKMIMRVFFLGCYLRIVQMDDHG